MQDFAPPIFETKICAPENVPKHLHTKPIVFTNGCFDILHRGHVTYLAQAKAQGAYLIVALNTDASVKRQGKDKHRPINPLSHRLAVIAALASVDLVTWFDEDTPLKLIELIQPHILVKGGDWHPQNIIGAKETLERGGRVLAIPFLYQTSTTKTLHKIRKQER